MKSLTMTRVKMYFKSGDSRERCAHILHFDNCLQLLKIILTSHTDKGIAVKQNV